MKDLSLVLLFCLAIFSFNSCDNAQGQKGKTAKTEPVTHQPEPKVVYGFNLADFEVIRDTVKSGDTFGRIMNSNGVSLGRVYTITSKIQDTFDTRSITIGTPYAIVKSKDTTNTVHAFVYQNNKIHYTVIDLADTIAVRHEQRPVTIKRRSISGVINSSLSQAMDDAGSNIALIHKLVNIYQWKIDFFRLQKGDKFKVIFNEKYIQDSIYAGIDDVIAAEFMHYDEPYYAFEYGQDSIGFPKYYNEKAESLQNFFLMAPVDYTRISSRYSLRRFHPVQKRWKAHLGTDYAAPTGTPIVSTADGVVIASRYNRFNGNYVKIRHTSKYTTQYLHMSKRAVSLGEHVRQGEVIGYVGQTGLATGPHVCYRFWVNGKQVDPYKQDLPSSEPLADSIKADYLESIKPLKEELNNIEIPELKEHHEPALANVIQ